MQEELVNFQVAKLAKEKGFGLGEKDYIELHRAYELDGSLYNNGEIEVAISKKYNNSPNHLGADTMDDFEGGIFIIDNSLEDFILAPTQSLLQRWLREIHNVYITIHPKITPSNDIVWFRYKGKPKKDWINCYKNYEEALEAGLLEALTLIKIK